MMHRHAKFHQNRATICRDIVIFQFFKVEGVRHFGFLRASLDHPRRVLGGLYHFAKFGCNWCSSFEIMKVSIFCTFGFAPIYAPKVGVLEEFHPFNRQQYQRNSKEAHPCACVRCLSYQF